MSAGGRRIAATWLLLMALLAGSLASAFVPLGGFQLAVALGVAALKSALVLWRFMGWPGAGSFARAAAGVAAAALVLLLALSDADLRWRETTPTAVQPVVPVSPAAGR